MNNWNEFDKLLGQNIHDIEYWENEEIEHALDLIIGFNDDDWSLLQSSWKSRVDIWKERCAKLLDANKGLISLSILLEMLESGNLEITVNAVESLQGFEDVEDWSEMTEGRVKIATKTIQSSNLHEKFKADLLKFLSSKS